MLYFTLAILSMLKYHFSTSGKVCNQIGNNILVYYALDHGLKIKMGRARQEDGRGRDSEPNTGVQDPYLKPCNKRAGTIILNNQNIFS